MTRLGEYERVQTNYFDSKKYPSYLAGLEAPLAVWEWAFAQQGRAERAEARVAELERLEERNDKQI